MTLPIAHISALIAVRRRGAPVEYFSHSASFHSGENITPSKSGIKHLVQTYNSGDLIALAEVVRNLHHNDEQREQSYCEHQLYEAALERRG